MTDKLRAAAEMALKALENVPIEFDYHGNPMYVESNNQLEAAIEALRQALDQLPDSTKMMGLIQSEWAGLEKPPNSTTDVVEREWQGLTDDEIAETVGSPIDEVYLADFRKVEAKLREKNT